VGKIAKHSLNRHNKKKPLNTEGVAKDSGERLENECEWKDNIYLGENKIVPETAK